METELIDFDEWTKTQQVKEVNYFAVFNTDGLVLGIYPENAVVDKENKIPIDQATAEKIQQGVLYLHRCFVDVLKKKFLIAEEVSKKDNVLHRVPEKRWSNKDYFDLYIEYSPQTSSINIALTERFSGTRKDVDTDYKSKVFNDSHVEVLLYFTEYNDPNVLFYSLKFSLSQLYHSEKKFDDILLPEKFSVYTRRYFDDYVLEIL
jgi:hypothetical protein